MPTLIAQTTANINNETAPRTAYRLFADIDATAPFVPGFAPPEGEGPPVVVAGALGSGWPVGSDEPFEETTAELFTANARMYCSSK